MSLPLCTTPQRDSLVWPAEKCGQFSVKSGYKCLCEDSQASDPVSEFPEVQRSLWKGIWKLNVPGKIKHFLWKSCTNSLPTKNNLLKRTIISEDVCHLCSTHPEDVMHALWGCSKVYQVWQRSFGWLDHNQVAEGSFSDLVRLVQTKPKMFPLFAVTAWAVWHHRNKSRLQVVSIPLNRLATFAETYLQNYTAGHGQRLPPVRSVTGAVNTTCSYSLTSGSYILLVLLLLGLNSGICHGLGSFGFDIHHRFSDPVMQILGFEGLPEKRSVEYYVAMTHRDSIIRGRHLAASNNQSPAPLTFANGNDTFYLNNLGSLYYANVSVGTPSVSYLVALDTGSDLFWLPCDCNNSTCETSFQASSGRFNSQVTDNRHSSNSQLPFEYCYDLSANQTGHVIPIINLTMKGGDQYFLTNSTEIIFTAEACGRTTY
nr:aspartyl protease family protein 1 [Quercus suber]